MTNVVLIEQATLNEFRAKLDSILSKLDSKEEPLKEWLTTKEAMKILGIKQTTLWAYRRDGRLTFTKINRKVFVLRNDLLKLLDQNKIIGYQLRPK